MKVGEAMDGKLLKGKTAIVTGANQGIGQEIAAKLVDSGAIVLLVDINENINNVAKIMNDENGKLVYSFQGDLTDENDVSKLIHFAKKTLGRIDILVNNAGIMQTKAFLEITGEEWDKVLTINLKTMFILSQQVVKEMLEQETKGIIINISSIAGRSGRPLAPHYAASKAGVLSLTKSMAEAFGKQNIRTNAICPGVIYTDMMKDIINDRKKMGVSENVENDFLENIHLDRLGTPEDIAKVVLFLSSPFSDYINGQAINVCGGYEMD